LHRQFHKTLLLTRCGLEIVMVLLAGCFNVYAQSGSAQLPPPAANMTQGRLAISDQTAWMDSPAEAHSIMLLPGQIVPVRQFYYLPVASATEGYGVGPSHTYGTPCVACRVENPNVARLRYSPTAGCYLPPDFDGALAEPCGISPGEVFLEGLVRGETTITATIEKNGETLSASTAIRVTDRSDGLVVVSPRWGEKLKQGEKHVIAWRCGGCPASVHMIATIFDDAERVGGVIARLQPANGSYTWDARTVCGKPTPESSSPCEDLRPGYYHISVAEEVDGEDLMRGLFASSAPFQIVSADGASPVPDITADSVKGAIVALDLPDTNFAWLQTMASGKRLICLAPATPVSTSSGPRDWSPSMFTAGDLPLNVTVEAEGVWEDAHSVTCAGNNDDYAAPPRLKAKEVRLANSGIFGTFELCKSAGNQEVCRNASGRPLQLTGVSAGSAPTYLQPRPLNGKYLAPLHPGHYYLFNQPVEVKPSQWTRADIKLPDNGY
jgi:hypothetical protein